jgi:hypothetical protein
MKPKVIAVHGTYVADPSDHGDQWWQKGGALERFLRRDMTDAIDAGDLIVFHWSGENSAIARQKAGADLFRLMQTLERERVSYHVIAHSHGGGVLLEALTEAVEHARRTRVPSPLRGLRSWTTVGTPFLTASPAPHWSNRLRNPYRMLLALSLAALNVILFARLIALPFHPMHAWIAGIMILGLLQATTLSGRLSANGYLLTRLDACTEAMQRFGDRCLPLWSSGDEALTSLTLTGPQIQLKVVKAMRPAIHPHTPLRSLLRWPLAFAVAQGINLARPHLNRTVASGVRRALQGYDQPFGEVVSIGAGPLPPFHAYPSLPPHIDGALIERANDDAQKGIATMRSVLYAAATSGASVTGFAESLQTQLAGGSLVHTRYFDHDEILRMIELHMRGTHHEADGELPEWFGAMRRAIANAVANAPAIEPRLAS